MNNYYKQVTELTLKLGEPSIEKALKNRRLQQGTGLAGTSGTSFKLVCRTKTLKVKTLLLIKSEFQH